MDDKAPISMYERGEWSIHRQSLDFGRRLGMVLALGVTVALGLVPLALLLAVML